jgi:hypothetical protein
MAPTIDHTRRTALGWRSVPCMGVPMEPDLWLIQWSSNLVDLVNFMTALWRFRACLGKGGLTNLKQESIHDRCTANQCSGRRLDPNQWWTMLLYVRHQGPPAERCHHGAGRKPEAPTGRGRICVKGLAAPGSPLMVPEFLTVF